MKTVADLIAAVTAKLTVNFSDIEVRSTDLDKHPEKCFYTVLLWMKTFQCRL